LEARGDRHAELHQRRFPNPLSDVIAAPATWPLRAPPRSIRGGG